MINEIENTVNEIDKNIFNLSLSFDKQNLYNLEKEVALLKQDILIYMPKEEELELYLYLKQKTLEFHETLNYLIKKYKIMKEGDNIE